MLSRIDYGVFMDVFFQVSVHDCVQTASMTHAYRGPKHYESRPVFTIVGCNFSDNIPIPLWPSNIENGGGYSSWDDTVSIYITVSSSLCTVLGEREDG